MQSAFQQSGANGAGIPAPGMPLGDWIRQQFSNRTYASGVMGVGALDGKERIEHPAFGAVSATYTPVMGTGNDEVFETLALMKKYAVEDASSDTIKADAQRVKVMAMQNGTPLAHEVWRYVRGRVQFKRDEELTQGLRNTQDDPVIEILVRPVDMSGGGVASRMGDCDDFSMWASSILCALGVPNSFVVMAGDGRDPSRYSHVYVAAYENGKRIAVDASHGSTPGWESKNLFGLRDEYPVKGSLADMSALLLIGALYFGYRWMRKGR